MRNTLKRHCHEPDPPDKKNSERLFIHTAGDPCADLRVLDVSSAGITREELVSTAMERLVTALHELGRSKADTLF